MRKNGAASCALLVSPWRDSASERLAPLLSRTGRLDGAVANVAQHGPGLTQTRRCRAHLRFSARRTGGRRSESAALRIRTCPARWPVQQSRPRLSEAQARAGTRQAMKQILLKNPPWRRNP